MGSSAARTGPRARDVTVTDDELIVALTDGRRIAVPLDWFPRLRAVSLEARRRWTLLRRGPGIRWPEVDEDVSVAGLFRGEGAEK